MSIIIEDFMMHTPGPWVAEPEHEGDPANYVHKNGRAIADCMMGYGAEDEANARLIAAAPDMLAALRIIAGMDQCIDNLMSNQDVARAAIAKAEPAN